MPKAGPGFISRFPMERMFRIHERLKAKRYPNAKSIAKDFEVCEKTVKRDMGFMRDRLRLPIEYDPHRYGYYYTKPVDVFPDLPLSEREIFALIALGRDNEGIAKELGIAEQTVRNHVSIIYSKLEVKDRFEIIQLANEIRYHE